MPKKDPKDSHRVITRAERKARKEHESAANIAGAKATGEAGNERDRLANEVPEVEATVSIEEHIEIGRAHV